MRRVYEIVRRRLDNKDPVVVMQARSLEVASKQLGEMREYHKTKVYSIRERWVHW